jgi:replicative DNA helicase
MGVVRHALRLTAGGGATSRDACDEATARMIQREQPHNLWAERSALGSVFIKPATLDELADLQVDDFFLPGHREIFDAMRALAERRRAVDVISVADELQARGMLNRLDGSEAYLLALANETPTAENARQYGRLVMERATLRRLIAATAEIQSAAYGDPGDVSEFLSEVRRKIWAVDLIDPNDEPRRIGDELEGLLDSISARAADPGGYFVKTYIRAFDERVGGMRGGNLIIVAGRPGKGKSAFAKDVAVNNALAGVPALVFSFEMTKAEIGERVISGQARVNGRNIVRGKLDGAEWSRVTRACSKISALPLWFYDKPLTVERICAMARRWFARLPDPPDGRKKRAVIVVDYIGLVKSTGNEETRALEVAMITAALKALATELDVPIVALAQLNREIEKAAKARKPQPSDLRDSGALEQDANMIIFPWWQGEAPATGKHEALLIVGKNRGGPTGDVEIYWWPEYTTFTDQDDSAFTLFDGTGETGRVPYVD